MSELKTFKCDACGEVYHSDDRTTRIIMSFGDEDKTYGHVCPKCLDRIATTLASPCAFEQLKAEKDRAINYAYNLEHVIKDLRDKIGGWWHWPGFHFSDDAVLALEHWKGVAKEIETKYTETKNSMLKWRLSTIALIGTIVCNILYVIIK